MKKVVKFINELRAEYYAFRIRVHSFGFGKQGKLDCELWCSISDQKYDDALKCLNEGANPNSFEKQGKTCQLSYAVMMTSEAGKKIAKLLLDFGANPEGINNSKDTPLNMAKHLENTEMIEYLTKMIEQKNTKTNKPKM